MPEEYRRWCDGLVVPETREQQVKPIVEEDQVSATNGPMTIFYIEIG